MIEIRPVPVYYVVTSPENPEKFQKKIFIFRIIILIFDIIFIISHISGYVFFKKIRYEEDFFDIPQSFLLFLFIVILLLGIISLVLIILSLKKKIETIIPNCILSILLLFLTFLIYRFSSINSSDIVSDDYEINNYKNLCYLGNFIIDTITFIFCLLVYINQKKAISNQKLIFYLNQQKQQQIISGAIVTPREQSIDNINDNNITNGKPVYTPPFQQNTQNIQNTQNNDCPPVPPAPVAIEGEGTPIPSNT